MKPKSYIICSTPRSGSTLLCKTLAQLGGLGQPEEYFHRHTIEQLKLNNNPEKFISYCQSIFEDGLKNHGIFGMKMHWWQLLDFLTLARQSPCFEKQQDLEILSNLFPNPKFIYLWRRNIIAQAVSATLAMQTGQWEIIKKNKAKKLPEEPLKPLKFRPWRIYEWEKSTRENNHHWRQFLKANLLNYYEIVYEDMLDSFVDQISDVVNYIDSNKNQIKNEIQAPTQRQFNKINHKFITYYQLCPQPITKLLYWLYSIKISKIK